jgi:Tfp pilus assembly protein PilW
MRCLLLRRLPGGDREAGMTLVELLVAASMGVILLGAVGSMLISAVRDQPKLSKRSQNIATARTVLGLMTRELRNGVTVYEGTSSRVSFLTSVRRTSCGGSVQTVATVSSIRCRVTYACSGSSCTRTETAPEATSGGTAVTLVSGLASSSVFNYSPTVEEPTYVGVTLRIPNPEGSGNLTISDGASLRTLDLAN